jgi:excisionase family DNA binding protein
MEILNSDELAALLQAPRSKVILAAKRGEIPAYLLFGKLLFDADEISEWIKKLRLQPGDSVGS